VIDFDAALRDPANPARMAARYDSGDICIPARRGTKRWGMRLIWRCSCERGGQECPPYPLEPVLRDDVFLALSNHRNCRVLRR